MIYYYSVLSGHSGLADCSLTIEYKRGLEMLRDVLFAGLFWLMVIAVAIAMPMLIHLIGGAI